MPGASLLYQDLYQLWRPSGWWLKVPPWCSLASQHLRPALFSVPHLCAPTQEGRTDRTYWKSRRATAYYCLFSLFPPAFSPPSLPHLSSPLVKSQADCHSRRSSFLTASPMDGMYCWNKSFNSFEPLKSLNC